jgi:hypothetical protein
VVIVGLSHFFTGEFMQNITKKQYQKPEVQMLSTALHTATKNTAQKLEEVVKGNSKGIS